jgi:hypothetical protein
MMTLTIYICHSKYMEPFNTIDYTQATSSTYYQIVYHFLLFSFLIRIIAAFLARSFFVNFTGDPSAFFSGFFVLFLLLSFFLFWSLFPFAFRALLSLPFGFLLVVLDVASESLLVDASGVFLFYFFLCFFLSSTIPLS